MNNFGAKEAYWLLSPLQNQEGCAFSFAGLLVSRISVEMDQTKRQTDRSKKLQAADFQENQT